MNLEELKKPFPPSEINWRIGQAGKKKNGEIWAKVLAYLDSRAVMDRLDEVCGPGNWQTEYKEWSVGDAHGVICGISIKIGDEWITKWDGAGNTDFEAIKGGLSDSFKRAAVHWGIGRYLYGIGESWATVRDGGKHYANCKIKVNGKDEYVSFSWDAPSLPDSALPSNYKPEPKGKRQESKPEPKPEPKPESNLGDKLTIESVPEEHREFVVKAQADINQVATVKELTALWQGSICKKPKPVQEYMLPLFSARRKAIEGTAA